MADLETATHHLAEVLMDTSLKEALENKKLSEISDVDECCVMSGSSARSAFTNDAHVIYDTRSDSMDLKWQDTEDIAIRLVEEHPETDPLTVRFTDMHAWIVALPDFKDDPKKSNEKILEAIQMAWHEEYQDSKS